MGPMFCSISTYKNIRNYTVTDFYSGPNIHHNGCMDNFVCGLGDLPRFLLDKAFVTLILLWLLANIHCLPVSFKISFTAKQIL